MTERVEKTRQIRIAFFDADKTLWRVESHGEGDDYASKGAFEGKTRTFMLTGDGELTRQEDGTKLILKEGVTETLEKLAKEGIITGIISDNIYEDVEKVSQLLGIWQYFDKMFTVIRLWKGTADKGLMISEVLNTQEVKNPSVLLVDDSERYAQQMANAGYDFILSPKDNFPKDTVLAFFGLG